MRGLWKGIGCLTLLLGLGGCATDANRPPPRADELMDVPDEKRYEEPPVPPKSNSPEDPLSNPAKSTNPGMGMPRSPNRPGTPGGPGSAATGY
jgi:hypothetical protein